MSRIIALAAIAAPLLYAAFLFTTHNMDIAGARRFAELQMAQARAAGSVGLPIDAFYYVLRGAIVVALLASIGLCLGMLLRSPVTVLAVALVYVLAIEAALRAMLPSAGTFLLSGATGAALEPLSPLTTPTGPCEGAGCDPPATPQQVITGVVTLLVMVLALFIAAQLSNVRRDAR